MGIEKFTRADITHHISTCAADILLVAVMDSAELTSSQVMGGNTAAALRAIRELRQEMSDC